MYGQNVIFVFGSNKSGIHGAGAAQYAHKHLGAEWGVGEGLTGYCYALPTKDERIQEMDLNEIKQAVFNFLETCTANPQKIFVLTPIACGLGGKHRNDIIPMLRQWGKLPPNIVLSTTWVLESNGTPVWFENN